MKKIYVCLISLLLLSCLNVFGQTNDDMQRYLQGTGYEQYANDTAFVRFFNTTHGTDTEPIDSISLTKRVMSSYSKIYLYVCGQYYENNDKSVSPSSIYKELDKNAQTRLAKDDYKFYSRMMRLVRFTTWMAAKWAKDDEEKAEASM